MANTALIKFGKIPNKYGQPGSFSNLDADWWHSLPKTPEADELIRELKKTQHEIVFCTKTCSDACTIGKVHWLREHYPGMDYMIVTTKEPLTGLIIDDHPNLKFSGRQVLWPQPYNNNSAIKDKVKYAIKVIRKIAG